MISSPRVLAAWTDVVEPNQVNVLAFPVLGDLEQIDDTQETRLSRQCRRDLQETDGLDRIHFDLTLFHTVPGTHLDVGTGPDSDTASDFSATNSLAKTLSEHHEGSLHSTEDESGGPRRFGVHPQLAAAIEHCFVAELHRLGPVPAKSTQVQPIS